MSAAVWFRGRRVPLEVIERAQTRVEKIVRVRVRDAQTLADGAGTIATILIDVGTSTRDGYVIAAWPDERMPTFTEAVEGTAFEGEVEMA